MIFKESIFYKVFSAILGFYAAIALIAVGIGIVVGILSLCGLI